MWALLVFAWVVEEQACCGRVCLWVVGFGVYVRGVFVWVFAFLVLACLFGVVGRCGSAAPLFRLVCLRVRALVWVCWRVRYCVCLLRAGVAGMGWGMVVPPLVVWWRCTRCVRVEGGVFTGW